MATRKAPLDEILEAEEELLEEPLPIGPYEGNLMYTSANGFSQHIKVYAQTRADVILELRQMDEELAEAGCKPKDFRAPVPQAAPTPLRAVNPTEASGGEEALPCDSCGKRAIKGFATRDGNVISAQQNFNSMRNKIGQALCYGCKKNRGLL